MIKDYMGDYEKMVHKNKMIKISLLALVTTSLFSVVGCNKNDPKPIPPDPTLKLDAPVVDVSNDGVVTWNIVEHADLYKVNVNNQFVFETSEYSYEITATALGNYSVYVVAFDTDNIYEHSDNSNVAIYNINRIITSKFCK